MTRLLVMALMLLAGPRALAGVSAGLSLAVTSAGVRALETEVLNASFTRQPQPPIRTSTELFITAGVRMGVGRVLYLLARTTYVLEPSKSR